MNNIQSVSIAVIFFILGSIACHFYKRHVIRDLEDGVLAWKMQAEVEAERLLRFKCPRPHIGDISHIDSDISTFLGYTLNELNDSIDKQLKEIKETFGV
jgi:hypothetical protein